MTSAENPDVGALLASLTTHDVDPLRRERTRRRAHEVLARHLRRLSRIGNRAGILYTRYLEPVLAVAVVAVVLTWAFQRAAFVLLPA
jgi:hypothetical protein